MMKRLFFLLTALLTLSAGLWAQTQFVTYIDENGVAQTVYSVNVITNSTTTLNAGWYVVTGTDVQTGSLTCNGEVHLILADDAKLTATGGYFQAGIQVSGEGNSLTIYGQDAQSGKLNATGGDHAAGIGGGFVGFGSNITINGGMVTATGGVSAAGIGGGDYGFGSNITINGGTVWATGGEYAAGIGGGDGGSGSNITINGGTVTARGEYSSGIGGGFNSSGSDIFMPVNYRIKADGTFIHNDGTDLAGSLAGKQNVEAYPDGLLNERNAAFAAISAAVEGISDEAILAMADAAKEAVFQAESLNDINIVLAKINAIAEITTAREGIQNEFVNLWIDAAITDINKPGTDTEEKVNNIKDKIFDLIEAFQEGKTEGKAEAAAELLGSMGEPCTDCPAVEISDDNTTIKLYNPKKVEFMKIQSEE